MFSKINTKASTDRHLRELLADDIDRVVAAGKAGICHWGVIGELLASRAESLEKQSAVAWQPVRMHHVKPR